MTETRDQKLRTALGIYFNNSILFSLHNLPIEWEIELLTRKTRRHYHEYLVYIPLQVVRYHADGYHDVNGQYHQPLTQYGFQNVPHITNLKRDFNSYFSQYALIENNTMVSYVHVEQTFRTNEHVILEVNVQYNKKHQPYSVDEDEDVCNSYLYRHINYLNKQNADMMYEIEDLNYTVSKMEEVNSKIHSLTNHKKYLGQFDRLTMKIKDFYKETGKYEECPVCYEVLNDKSLIVTNCSHSLCRDCHTKCTFCPICRDTYMTKEMLSAMEQPTEAGAELEDGEVLE